MPRADVEVDLEAFARHRDDPALVHGERRMTHGEVVDAVYRTARALDALPAPGLRPGDIVVLLGGNEPEMLIGRWATALLGVGSTQPYAGLSDAARGRIVDDVEAAAVLVAPGHEAEADAVLAHAGPVPRVVLDPDLTAEVSPEPVACRARQGDVEQIRHTGGTTGHPKGITYTFEHHLRVLESTTRPAPQHDEPPRQLVATTIAHAAGSVADATLRAGGSVVLLDRFDPDEVLAAVERERITDLWLLPPLLHRLLDCPRLERTDTTSLRRVIYGGAPAVPARIAEAVRRIGRVFLQFYGQTEAGAISVLTPEEHDDPALLATVGRVVPTTELAVCDADGRRRGDGEPGELWVRTGTAMSGYWKQPELTAATTTPDGWVRTGDVGHLDERGYLHVDDRIGDVVVVVGGHVHTPEVENVLVGHPAVREAAVFGAPDADGSETVHAAVTASGTAGTVDTDGLRELVAERQGRMAAPVAVDVVEEMPLTDAGKVDKVALRDRAG